MLPPDIFIKRKYKEQYNLGINLETKSERKLPNEMFKLDEQPSCLKAQSIAADLNLKT